MITKQQTIFLKGIAIVMVLIGHCIPPFLPFSEIYVPLKKITSQVGVEIFLILSGYGVAITYLTGNVKPSRFITRRLLKLWPLYTITILIYYLFSILLFQEEISAFSVITHFLWLQTLFGTQGDIYSASHFFTALLVVYLFAVIMMFFRQFRVKIIVFLLAVTTFQIVCLYWVNRLMFTNYIASFSLGLVLGLIFQKNSKVSHTIFYLLLSYLFCFFDIYQLQKALMGVLCFFLSWLISKRYNQGLLNEIISVLGENSYIIYLGHNYFLWKWPIILIMTGSYFSTGAVILVFTSIWLAILFIGNKMLNNWIVNPAMQSKYFIN